MHFAPSVGDVGGDAKEPYPQIFDLSVPKTSFQQFIEIAAAEIGQDRERQRPQVVPERNIEKNVSIDPTRPCIHTYNKHIKIHVRINSTVKVTRACMFIMWSVLEGTQRVPPTCTTKTSRT